MLFYLMLLLCIVWACIRIRRAPIGKRRRMALAILSSLIGFYLLCVALLYFFQGWLLFPATKAAVAWEPMQLFPAKDISLTITEPTTETIHAWWLPVKKPRWTVLVSHGNAANLSFHMRGFTWLLASNCNVLIYDYPGYGKSTGSPSEAGCYASARAAYRWLTEEEKVPSSQIILLGCSMGGAMATELATHCPHHLLALYESFTSIPDVASELYPIFPIRMLCLTQFDNLSKLPSIKSPVIIGHGKEDRLIPYQQSEKLHEAITGKKKLRLFEKHQHGQMPAEFLEAMLRMAEEAKD